MSAIKTQGGVVMRKNIQRLQEGPQGSQKKASRGQVLAVTLVFGAILLIFALTMVTMLRSTIKLSVTTVAGTSAVLGSDAVVDKAIHALEEGNNWGSSPGLVFTPIPGYKADKVYTDIPNAQYVVQIDKGNLLVPPGDLFYERTITVDMYSTKIGQGVPTAQPTPWLRGGPIPADYTNHRRVQATVRRGTLTSALTGGGSLVTNGNFSIYWGDVFDYYVPTAVGVTISMDLSHGANIGPGYPSYHTIGYGQPYGCIKSTGSCVGCLGTGTGSGALFCNITDSGAANCKMYPSDPNMPPKPSVDLPGLKTTAQAIYKQGLVSSGESGYFYFSSTISGAVTGADSISIAACGGCTMAVNEGKHQYNSTTDFDPGGGGGGAKQLKNVLKRMAVNLNAGGVTTINPATWVGADDLVVYIDTTDTNPLSSGISNKVIGGNAGNNYAIDFNGQAFRGTLVLLGSFACEGSNDGPSVLMSPSSSAWCPSAFTATPAFNGFLYIGGDCTKLTGNPKVYGSVDLEGDFTATGNADIYYRNDFNYNLIQSGTVATTGWKEVATFPTLLN